MYLEIEKLKTMYVKATFGGLLAAYAVLYLSVRDVEAGTQTPGMIPP